MDKKTPHLLSESVVFKRAEAANEAIKGTNVTGLTRKGGINKRQGFAPNNRQCLPRGSCRKCPVMPLISQFCHRS